MSESVSLASVCVVTVSYNSSDHLEPFLQSLHASEAESFSVIVADNRSEDIEATRALVAKAKATLLELDDNRGYGGAVNAAAAVLGADIEWIVVANPDVTFHAGAISAMLDAAIRHPDAASVGPRILGDDGTVYPSARRLPSLSTGLGHAAFVRVWPANPWTRIYKAEGQDAMAERYVGWLSGSCLLVRRSAFEALGGFDEGYFMYFEDVDLGGRIGQAGWKNLYAPEAVVTHSGAHSTSRDSNRMLTVHHASAYRYLQRKYSSWYLAPVRGMLWFGLTLRARWLTRRR
jgi:N-acetylglucosaminyl-diphospho-decaprenol L-rhamnosyltransferase